MLSFLVRPVAVKQFEILDAVVRRVVVPMVDDLIRRQMPPNVRLHHKPMLSNVTVSITARVVGAKHEPVFSLMEKPTATPAMVLFPASAAAQKIVYGGVIHSPTIKRTRHSAHGFLCVERRFANQTSRVRTPVWFLHVCPHAGTRTYHNARSV